MVYTIVFSDVIIALVVPKSDTRNSERSVI